MLELHEEETTANLIIIIKYYVQALNLITKNLKSPASVLIIHLIVSVARNVRRVISSFGWGVEEGVVPRIRVQGVLWVYRTLQRLLLFVYHPILHLTPFAAVSVVLPFRRGDDIWHLQG